MTRLNKIELENFKNSREYNYLQNYFDDSGCNNPNLIGHCMKIIKNRQPQTFDEWIEYYVGHDAFRFTASMVEAAGKLQDFLYEKKRRRVKTKLCWDAVATLVLYQTWNGYKMELKAIDELNEDDYEIMQTNSKQDELYAIDLIVHKNNTPLLGIQVKPDKYAYIEEERKLQNKEKNKEFINKYNVGVKYLYYNDKFEFDKKDIEKTKEKIRKAIVCKNL